MTPSDKHLLTEFELYFDFAKASPDPQRVFRTLTRVLDVLTEFDTTLVRLLAVDLSTELTLHDIKAGAFRTHLTLWLVPGLPNFPSDSAEPPVAAADVARHLGGFINQALIFLLHYLENKQGLDNPGELRYLKDHLDQLAARAAHASGHPQWHAVSIGTLPLGKLADLISNLTKALAALQPQDRLEYRAAEGKARFNPRFITDNLSALAGAGLESSTQYRTRLRIKKPDFLGESRWEFRIHENHTIAAKITDDDWLMRFHAGEIMIKCGDLLEADLVTEYVHIPNYSTAQVHYTVPRVWAVVSPRLPPATPLFG